MVIGVNSSELEIEDDGFKDKNGDTDGIVDTGIQISDSNEKIDEEIDREDASDNSKEKADEFIDLKPVGFGARAVESCVARGGSKHRG